MATLRLKAGTLSWLCDADRIGVAPSKIALGVNQAVMASLSQNVHECLLLRPSALLNLVQLVVNTLVTGSR